MKILRDLLEEIGNSTVWTNKERDVEEFIDFLFVDISKATPFYKVKISTPHNLIDITLIPLFLH